MINSNNATRKQGIIRLLLMSTALAATVLTSACGGGGGGGSTPPPTPETPDSPPTVSTEARLLVSAGESVSLSASGQDPDGDTISYRWQQLNGNDVANTSGFDTPTASFSAPDEVGSIMFRVTATANGRSANADGWVVVVEDTDTAVFIDAQFEGSSDGTIDAPYREFTSLLEQSIDDNEDIDFYIKTPTNDSVYTLWSNDARVIRQNISFYGGYINDWERDTVSQRTPITTAHETGFYYSGTDQFIEVSGLDLTLTLESISNDRNVFGIYSIDLVELSVRDNTITVNDYPFDNSSGSLFGVMSDQVVSFSLINNTISTGAAPLSARDATNNNFGGGINGRNGNNGDNSTGGSGGQSNDLFSTGGRGGNGGRGFSEDGDAGGPARVSAGNGFGSGGAGGDASESDDDGENGRNGRDGTTGAHGDGGTGFGRFTNGGRFATSSGTTGRSGSDGTGGGGGGGGGASNLGFNGGGGGGGGQGGGGGEGGFAANSGGASIGVYLIDGNLNDIIGNTITSGNGGQGGIGGLGADGGSGGTGGNGAEGNNSGSGRGGNGGNGGNGGDGGIGGSGGGGPSFGILINANTFASVINNQITTGNAGNGGSAIIAIERSAGKGGWSVGVFDADTSDAASPVLEGNSFTLGLAGEDGNPSSGSGTAAETNF